MSNRWINPDQIKPGMLVEFPAPDGTFGRVYRIEAVTHRIASVTLISDEGKTLTPPERVFVWEDE